MIWLFGAGYMSRDYVRVLEGLEKEYIVIGRGEKSAELFQQETGLEVITGGVDSFLECNDEIAEAAIVAVSVERLAETAISLIQYGVQRILLEKPGGLDREQLAAVNAAAKERNAKVLIGYNRRFYQSLLAAEKFIAEDGGVQSFNFEFTEWGHVIQEHGFKKEALEKWFLGNSTHVVDMAFYLGGEPDDICCYQAGSLSWHSKAAIFAGAGVSKRGALFSYQANWGAPGRWGVEVLTANHRLILRPMERLAIQKIGSVAIEEFETDYSLDEKYKPGLFLQVKQFLDGNDDRFCHIDKQCEMMRWYYSISGY